MILAAGLSPAWQQILVFDRFATGEVNRVEEVHTCASGKVINVGLALAALKVESHTLTVVGGTTGQGIREEFRSRNIAATWIESDVSTRICTTIIDRSADATTELVENTAPLPQEIVDRFAAAFRELAVDAKSVVITGSSPHGTPATLYRDLLSDVAVPCVLDIRGAELLAALECSPYVVKPNRDELAATLGRDLSTDKLLLDAMRELNRRGAQWVVVTDGAKPVWITSRDASYRIAPPQIEVVNPIGCGDCLAAGIAWGAEQGLPPVDSVRLGIATAAENAARLLPARIDASRVRSLAAAITVETC